MDPGQSEYYEFLDLTDIDESERCQLNNTLFPSEQSSHDLSDSGVWNEESDWLSTLNSGSSVPPSESDFSMNGDHQAVSPQFGVGSQCPPPNTIYSAAPPYNMQPPGSSPSHMYHLMQPAPMSNVYVGNVTANVNVHGYLGHYVPFIPQGQVEQMPEVSSQRPIHNREHNPRGRRSRGGHNKRDYQQQRSQQIQQQHVQQDMVDVQQQQQPNHYQYMPIPYQSAYYPTGPQSHLAQHATGSPIYVGQHVPMYAPMPHLYQFHPGMVYSPVSVPPEYQLMDPTGKIESCELEMYPQASEIHQHMMGMNIQGEEMYNCLPTEVTNQVSDFQINQNDGAVLDDSNQITPLGIDGSNTVAENSNRIREEISQVDVLVNSTENKASISVEYPPSIVETSSIIVENSKEVSLKQSVPITNAATITPIVEPIEYASVADAAEGGVVSADENSMPNHAGVADTNMMAATVASVAGAGDATVMDASDAIVAGAADVSAINTPIKDCVSNRSTLSSQHASHPKSKGLFVNNKDIVKTGVGRKSTKPSQNKSSQQALTKENTMTVPALQPQEVQKLQSSKINDNRPKSQTPPNSVWVNNKLYTPPTNEITESIIPGVQLEINSELKNKPINVKSNTTKPINKENKGSEVNKSLEPAFEQLQAETSVAASQSKSWASLFNKSDILSDSISASISINPGDLSSKNSVIKPMAVVQPLENSMTAGAQNQIIQKSNKSQVTIHTTSDNTSTFLNDPNSYRAGEFLSKYNLDNRTVSLQPRGLTNRSNYCYINSTLQALLACPPLYNLLKALPHQISKKSKSSTPVLDAMTQLAYEFMPLPPGARVGRREKGHQRKDELPDVSTGPPFEPLVIHRMLSGFHPNTFQVEGRQEDAEEFLSCLLNGLNDEMVELIKLVEPEEKAQLSNGDMVNGHRQCDDDDNDDDDEWKVMGPKNKGSITRRSYFGRSPISDIFRGQLRSRVQRAGDLTTDSVQPFFTLQLDIEKAASVSQALELLVGRDQLEGVTCSKTNQEVEAWQQVSLEELPVVLILHLKWFDYKLDGCTKIVKNVDFPIDLKIDPKLMSTKTKYAVKQRQYKLFAVVYHDGKEASKGHYITDVFHVGFNGWIRYDDSVVKAVTENMVLHPRQPRVPYLLYYRRCDTIGPSNNVNQRTH
ncbi:uncharacterized protein LOC113366269 isoform X2 [Ctenocephalides felis]|uniref:uncharacterized protein LOC113366269 isoform X2 n=1 Tax=Ctenocephalides felis TaxID=7515 RepID=UPI000E6E3004|nr:uncharacterized protein LOC113366269 isoform X2 [Ctenocephalides felis]